jgi:ankyrin repeat protein
MSKQLYEALIYKARFDRVQELLQLYPESVKEDWFGFLPLHAALRYKASNDVITMIFKEYPKAAEVQDDNGYYPLHYACIYELNFRESFLGMVSLLVSAYPEGMDALDRYGKLPSAYLAAQGERDMYSTEHLCLLHKAIKAGFSIHLVKLLLRAFPLSCTAKDNNGIVPLHHACTSSAENHLEIAVTLLDADKDSLELKMTMVGPLCRS